MVTAVHLTAIGQSPAVVARLAAECARHGHRFTDGVGDVVIVEPGPTADDAGVRQLAGRRPRPIIAVLTAYASIAGALSLTRAGADVYLCQPASVAMVLAAIEGRAPAAPRGDLPSLARVEWEYISYVLALHRGSVSATARALGIHRQSLQRKLRKYPPPR